MEHNFGDFPTENRLENLHRGTLAILARVIYYNFSVDQPRLHLPLRQQQAPAPPFRHQINSVVETSPAGFASNIHPGDYLVEVSSVHLIDLLSVAYIL